MPLTNQHLQMIAADFPATEQERVKAELARLSTADTWDSEHNYNNAIGAIVALSKGDTSEFKPLVDAARLDFRDVIYWWSFEQKGKTE